jgi:hypothetical protein
MGSKNCFADTVSVWTKNTDSFLCCSHIVNLSLSVHCFYGEHNLILNGSLLGLFTHKVPSKRKIDFEKILASLKPSVCPKCGIRYQLRECDVLTPTASNAQSVTRNFSRVDEPVQYKRWKRNGVVPKNGVA